MQAVCCNAPFEVINLSAGKTAVSPPCFAVCSSHHVTVNTETTVRLFLLPLTHAPHQWADIMLSLYVLI